MTDRPNLYNLISELARSHQYVALGDTNHLNTDIQDLKRDPDLYAAIARAGFSTITIEQSPEDQEYSDNIRTQINAGADPNALRASIYSEADSILDVPHLAPMFDAANNGMELLYGDTRKEDPRFSSILSTVYQVIDLSPDFECADVFLQSYWIREPETNEYFESVIHSGDEDTAEIIATRTGDRAGFIIYGNAHFDGVEGESGGENDLDEMLGGENVAHIAAIGARENGYRFREEASELNPANAPPDYIYIVNEDAVIPFDLENPEIQEILGNHQSSDYDAIPRDVYFECLGELPDHLENFAPDRDDVSPGEKAAALAVANPPRQ